MKRNKTWMAVLLLMAFTSCVKTEFHYVDDSLKVWFVDHDKAEFLVRDESGITREFTVSDTTVAVIPGWSYFLFIKTDDDLCQSIFQNGWATYYEGNAFDLVVTNYYDQSTHFSLCFYDVCFTVDVEDGQFSCTECRDEKSLLGTVPCTLEMLDTYEVNGKVYQGVMHFTITDWNAVNSRNTFPSELYYAKHYGPIEYELGGDVRIKRL